jgi:hypothetical protein
VPLLFKTPTATEESEVPEEKFDLPMQTAFDPPAVQVFR